MGDWKISRPSTASLIGDALAKTSQLIGSELHLVQVEISEKITEEITAVVSMIVAAIFLIVALIFLLQGLVAVLVQAGLAASTANFAVGGGIAVVALITILIAARSLSASKLVPSRSLRQAHQSAELVRGPSR
jgi:hypothetical protein